MFDISKAVYFQAKLVQAYQSLGKHCALFCQSSFPGCQCPKAFYSYWNLYQFYKAYVDIQSVFGKYVVAFDGSLKYNPDVEHRKL